jgi:hypothetical protein
VGLYSERKFFQAELNSYLVAACVPMSPGNFGVKLGLAGSPFYQEMQAALAYARKLGIKADLGLQFNYSTIQIPLYGNSSAISFEAGTIFHISQKFHTGFHIGNPVGGRYGKNKEEKLPSIYTMGMGYSPSENLLVSIEITKEEFHPVEINAGIHYRILPVLELRLGMAVVSSTFSAGAGFSFKSFQLNILSSYHPQMGITPGLAIIFERAQKVKPQ